MLKRLAVALVAATIGFSSMVPQIAQADAPYWQCVTYARLTSGIEIRGDAWTWWNSAQGQYRTGSAPEIGSVLVFRPTGRMTRGHVAVVSEMLTDRVIRITHANWGGSRGKIEENVTVADVSAAGDWSQVKVWYAPINDLGSSVYPVYGFVHNERLGERTLQASLPSTFG